MRQWSKLRPKPRRHIHLQAIHVDYVGDDAATWARQCGGRVSGNRVWFAHLGLTIKRAPNGTLFIHDTQTQVVYLPRDARVLVCVSREQAQAMSAAARRAAMSHDAALSAHIEHETHGYWAGDLADVKDQIGEEGVTQLSEAIQTALDGVA